MMNKPEPSFGQTLRRLRQTAGLSQEDLAERAGLTSAAVGALERGERRYPYPHTLRALANALDLSPEDQATFFMSAPKRHAPGDERTSGALQEAHRRFAQPPRPLTPLVGRAQDSAIVVGLLRFGGARLVTLTGPGGVGKTRLAIEVAERLQNAFVDGLAWVDLAPLRESDLVLETISRALGQTERSEETISQGLERFLDHKELLLVLDNFEHLLASTSALLNLLERCPGVSVLVTSRASLGVRAEHEVQVRPLSLPIGEMSASVAGIAQSEAVELFLQRARAVQPALEISSADVPDVVAICTRLDGIPLALELAAVQLKYMSLATVQSRLSSRPGFLDSGLRDLPARQQSLRATVDWSYQLLTEPEQRLFRRLAIFASGFSMEAVEAVCSEDGATEDCARSLLALVDKSLVHAVRAPDANERFAMLETIREYARERLLESGEEASIAERHARYFCAVAETAAPHLPSAARAPWLQYLDTETANLREALAWTATRGDPCVGLRLAGALSWFWVLRGSIAEGTRWTDALLGQPIASCPDTARASALYAAAALAWKRGDLPAASHYAEASVTLRRALEDDDLAFSLALAGLIATAEGDLERARDLQQESLARFRSQENRWGVAYALANLGDAYLQHGDHAAAGRAYAESLQQFAAVDDAWGRGIVLHALGNIALASGDVATATIHYEACVALFRSIENRENVGRALVGLAAATLEQGDSARARCLLSESITIWHDLGSQAGMALCLAGLAGVAIAQGNTSAADRLCEAADVLGQSFAPPYLIDAAMFSQFHRVQRERSGGRLAASGLPGPAVMTPADAITIALDEASR